MKLPPNPTPSTLASEGRRLVTAYHAAYEGWRAATAAYTAATARDEPREVWKPLEDQTNVSCAITGICEQALLSFVVLTSRRKPLSPPSDCIDMDLWPAAAVLLDGRLWIASQAPNSDAGDLQLCHTVMADVVTLAAERGLS
jgi:hypothetical protein